MKLVIHIGTPKTGTSTLQHSLAQGRDTLAAAGLCYPALGRVPHHAVLSLTLGTGAAATRNLRQRYAGDPDRAAADLEAAWAAIDAAAAARPAILVLSSEHFFWRLTDAGAAALRARLERLAQDVRIIVYVRRPSLYFLSHVQQGLKRSANIPDPAGFDFAATLDRWERHFPGQLDVVPFDRARLRCGDIVPDFLGRIAPQPGLTLPRAPALNESMSAEGMALMQEYQRRWCRDFDDIQTRGKRALLALVQSFDARDRDTCKPRLAAGLAAALDHAMGDPDQLARRWGLDFAIPTAKAPLPRLVDVADLCELDTARLTRMRRDVFAIWGRSFRLRRRVAMERLRARLRDPAG